MQARPRSRTARRRQSRVRFMGDRRAVGSAQWAVATARHVVTHLLPSCRAADGRLVQNGIIRRRVRIRPGCTLPRSIPPRWRSQADRVELPKRVAAFFYLLVFVYSPADDAGLRQRARRPPPHPSAVGCTTAARAVNPQMNDLALQIVPWAHQVREAWQSLHVAALERSPAAAIRCSRTRKAPRCRRCAFSRCRCPSGIR